MAWSRRTMQFAFLLSMLALAVPCVSAAPVRGMLDKIDELLAAMGEDSGGNVRTRDKLIADGAGPNDPRFGELLAKVEKAYSSHLKNSKSIAETEKRIGLLGPYAGNLRERYEELSATSTRSGGRDWKDLRGDTDEVYGSYSEAKTDVSDIRKLLPEVGSAGDALGEQYESLDELNLHPLDQRWKPLVAAAAELRRQYIVPREELDAFDFEAVRRAIADLSESFPDRYTEGKKYLKRLDDFQQRLTSIREGLLACDPAAYDQVEDLLAVRLDALLANPVLDFDRLLVVRRAAVGKLGLPQNWQGNCALPKTDYDNEIAVLSPVRPGGRLTTLYRPPNGSNFVGDVDLHYDASRLLFSMPGSHDRWQIWEIGTDGGGLRQVTPGEYPSVDNYDACYLPDDRIIFGSTRCFHGVPCVGGNNTVANLFRMNADGSGIRQLCFDQDHDWCPTVLGDGRVLYTRWEYTDAPHYFTRLLFHMNPDGTGQMEYYGSNSPWPNSVFYTRPIPGHPTQVVGVVSGHHGVPRMGELVLFDPALGRREADGAVQRIPGYGQKVEPVIGDAIVNSSWPRFLHPFPLADRETGRGAGKYFLAACQPTSESNWGVYLVDVFDNITLIHEEPGYAIFEPVPLVKTARPPVVPDRFDPARNTAVVYLSDVYYGAGLEGVPRGSVKRLRVYEQHYAYPKTGGHQKIGIDGPWDVKRILGTVPVEADGSAAFTVPANTPLAVQPLDEQGQALQIMRSWFTAMPGEVVSCVGCHESQNNSPPSKTILAMQGPPSKIEPWHGPARGFSFKREVQPALDKHCIGCHDGTHQDRPNFSLADVDENGKSDFTSSYVALHPFVRRPGPESDYFMQKPLEFHAGTSELVQMLRKGHHNVKLDDEAWDRLITWIDLNVPDHGSWHEYREIVSDFHQQRLEMRTRFANRPEDPEAIYESAGEPIAFVAPEPVPEREAMRLDVLGWPFGHDEALRRQASVGLPVEQKVALGEDVQMQLALVPPGRFAMGSADGATDEFPPAQVNVARPFYLGAVEVTNRQYGLFDPEHDSAYISMTNKDHNKRGYPVNDPDQPVVRIRWHQAQAFCDWLSDTTGRTFRLPSEAEWEWACRAGTATAFSYGTPDSDFGAHANLADATVKQLALKSSPKWHPRDDRFSDAELVTAKVGTYEPNAWGLFDMHGNAAEWTATAWRPYPYDPADGRQSPQAGTEIVVRGGSWYDRPHRATSSFRLSYPQWQCVYNVGFRVVMEAE